jgi:hypothetical protein
VSPLDRNADTGFDRRIALALFVVALGAYAYFFNGGGWNQNSHFDLTRAIVKQHTFAIDAFAYNTGDVSRTGGHVYSNKPPGLSFLAVVPYALLVTAERAAGIHPSGIATLTFNAWSCTVAVCAVLGALVPVVLYRHARRAFSLSAGWAAAIASAAALGTPLLPYSTMLYVHVPSAALLWVGLGATSVAISFMATAVNLEIPWPAASPVGDYVLPLLLSIIAIMVLLLMIAVRSC